MIAPRSHTKCVKNTFKYKIRRKTSGKKFVFLRNDKTWKNQLCVDKIGIDGGKKINYNVNDDMRSQKISVTKKAVSPYDENLYGRSHRFIDLNVITCGHEQCSSVKYVGGIEKDFYTIHIVESGKGYIEYDGKKVALRTNEIFIVYPGKLVSYYPDPKNPWSYYWMTFEGVQADELVGRIGADPQRPYLVNEMNRQVINHFAAAMEAFEKNGRIVTECVGYLYVILGELSFGLDRNVLTMQQRYVKEALTFIYYNYNFDISVADIAKSLHISPNYLSTLFQSEVGMSTKQYLVKRRMEIALDHMKTRDMKIKDIAADVGYSDPLYFSKVFKNYYGKTPKEAIRELRQQDTV